jgi:hypothetical protein
LGGVESVERDKLHVGDVDFRMFRRGADIEKVRAFRPVEDARLVGVE